MSDLPDQISLLLKAERRAGVYLKTIASRAGINPRAKTIYHLYRGEIKLSDLNTVDLVLRAMGYKLAIVPLEEKCES